MNECVEKAKTNAKNLALLIKILDTLCNILANSFKKRQRPKLNLILVTKIRIPRKRC
jgi:hypothetical protein